MNVYAEAATGEIACPRCAKRKWSAERQGSVGARIERRCLWCGYSISARPPEPRVCPNPPRPSAQDPRTAVYLSREALAERTREEIVAKLRSVRDAVRYISRGGEA